MFTYEILRLIWWALLGILLIGFAVTDGFDLGAAILLPFVAKTDSERRVAINTIGPVWDGNQVWTAARSLPPGRRSTPLPFPGFISRCFSSSAP